MENRMRKLHAISTTSHERNINIDMKWKIQKYLKWQNASHHSSGTMKVPMQRCKVGKTSKTSQKNVIFCFTPVSLDFAGDSEKIRHLIMYSMCRVSPLPPWKSNLYNELMFCSIFCMVIMISDCYDPKAPNKHWKLRIDLF